jgi:putative flippase GtrA
MRDALARIGAWPRPLRFLLAGGVAAGINWAARFPLSLLLPFWAAVLGAAAIGMLVGFVAYRGIVFAPSGRPLLPQLRDFVAVNLASSLLVVGLAVLLLAPLGRLLGTPALAEAAAHALAIAAGAGANYLGHSLVTFRRRTGVPADA